MNINSKHESDETVLEIKHLTFLEQTIIIWQCSSNHGGWWQTLKTTSHYRLLPTQQLDPRTPTGVNTDLERLKTRTQEMFVL